MKIEIDTTLVLRQICYLDAGDVFSFKGDTFVKTAVAPEFRSHNHQSTNHTFAMRLGTVGATNWVGTIAHFPSSAEVKYIGRLVTS